MRVRLSVLCRVPAIILLVGTLAPVGLWQDCTVSAVLRVLDKQDQPVTGVTAGRLKAEINGDRATISSFSPAKPAVILVLDASGSMNGIWNQAIAAARELVGKSGEDIEAFVFDDEIHGHAIGHTGSEKLLDHWATEIPRHGTSLYDVLIEIASRVTTRNAAIVVITDGSDDASTHSSSATESLFLHSSWPPVFGLILTYKQDSNYRDRVTKILVATGGLVARPSSASKVPAAMEKLEAAVLTPFAVTLLPSRPVPDGSRLKLEVLGANGKPRHDVRTLYPVGVAGCDSGTPAGPR